ncbi:MAG: sigma-70 family RNA polymerase sigma factor [Verrucomicrobia bacterium]|nr:sigma-70 family RNA polymerase sigma factor [Verrucomicrobiota bacterium]
MPSVPSPPCTGKPSQEWFATTHWSVVLAARQSEDSGAVEALEKLCQTYWYPLYAYVRRHGHDVHDAEDLTQEFFARLLEKDFLKAVEPGRGKFRWFLLSAIKRFLANEWNRAHALKRGGGARFVSWDQQDAESRYRRDGASGLAPEKLFDQSWAMTLLEQAHTQLREEFTSAGQSGLFEQLKHFLSSDKSSVSYAEAARALGMTEGAARVAVHRLRLRYREFLRAQIAQTVTTLSEVDDEIRHLFAAFGG